MTQNGDAYLFIRACINDGMPEAEILRLGKLKFGTGVIRRSGIRSLKGRYLNMDIKKDNETMNRWHKEIEGNKNATLF